MTEKEFRDKYYKKAKDVTVETLPAFIKEMMAEPHDYGSVCCAVAASALAAAWAANNCDHGGITGFQAGAVMWEFIRQWNFSSNKCGLRITDYDNMLFPQYDHTFTKTISKKVWASLQQEAYNKLKDVEHVSPTVLAHWKSIVNGTVPFGYTIKV